MLEHYLVCTPKPGREDELSAALDRFGAGVRHTLPSLIELSWGRNTNPSGLDRGYTHSCLARLTSQEALRGEYWNHPAHVRLLADLDELCTERFAMDYVCDETISGAGPEEQKR